MLAHANCFRATLGAGYHLRQLESAMVTALIPDPVEKIKGTSATEDVAADAAGNVYGAEVGPKRVMKYVRK